MYRLGFTYFTGLAEMFFLVALNDDLTGNGEGPKRLFRRAKTELGCPASPARTVAPSCQQVTAAPG